MIFFISTPIGNMKDITLRALEILKDVDIIVCENTSHSLKLLKTYGIKKRLISYNEYNEDKRIPFIIKQLKKGKKIGFITNAGAPIISDPGYPLLSKVIEEDLPYTYIPGASAPIAALILSGFPPSRFVFEGFLPKKGKKRKKRLISIMNERRTVIVFESPTRIKKTLKDMMDIGMEEREIALVREMTKIHEGVIRGRIKDIINSLEDIKGEITIVIKGKENELERC